MRVICKQWQLTSEFSEFEYSRKARRFWRVRVLAKGHFWEKCDSPWQICASNVWVLRIWHEWPFLSYLSNKVLGWKDHILTRVLRKSPFPELCLHSNWWRHENCRWIFSCWFPLGLDKFSCLQVCFHKRLLPCWYDLVSPVFVLPEILFSRVFCSCSKHQPQCHREQIILIHSLGGK